jgi:Trk K+ transport system NAD-binding subunit
VAIGRLGVAQIPKSDLVAQEGDIAYVAVGGDAIAAFDERLAQGATGRH